MICSRFSEFYFTKHHISALFARILHNCSCLRHWRDHAFFIFIIVCVKSECVFFCDIRYVLCTCRIAQHFPDWDLCFIRNHLERVGDSRDIAFRCQLSGIRIACYCNGDRFFTVIVSPACCTRCSCFLYDELICTGLMEYDVPK